MGVLISTLATVEMNVPHLDLPAFPVGKDYKAVQLDNLVDIFFTVTDQVEADSTAQFEGSRDEVLVDIPAGSFPVHSRNFFQDGKGPWCRRRWLFVIARRRKESRCASTVVGDGSRAIRERLLLGKTKSSLGFEPHRYY